MFISITRAGNKSYTYRWGFLFPSSFKTFFLFLGAITIEAGIMKDIFIDFNIKFGVEKIWKWKWWILGACVVAAVGSFIYSSQMDIEYKSTASFVPPNFSTLTSLAFNNGVGYRGFEAAEEEDIDRTVDYLNSAQVIDSIAEEFKLYEHYGIKKGTKNADKIFYHVYSTKNEVNYTSRSTVGITCFDTDPEIAAAIADRYLEFANEFFETISQRKNGMEVSLTLQSELETRRQVLLDSLTILRNMKIYRGETAEGPMSSLVVQQIRSNPDFGKYYDLLSSYGLQLVNLEDRLGDLEREIQSRRIHLEQFPSLMQVTRYPTVSTFKARPKRSIYVAIATLAAFLFAVFMVLILDRSKDKLPI